ncbi:MAG: hypothetical protein U1E53_32405 [Dongiaceae bacterium]
MPAGRRLPPGRRLDQLEQVGGDAVAPLAPRADPHQLARQGARDIDRPSVEAADAVAALAQAVDAQQRGRGRRLALGASHGGGHEAGKTVIPGYSSAPFG